MARFMRPLSSVEDRVRVALLQSERILATVLNYLAHQPGAALPELRREAWWTVAAPDSRMFRQDDIDATLDRAFMPMRPGTTAKGAYQLTFLFDLAEEYLFFDGDRVTVRPERLLDYMTLISEIDPAFLIGAMLAGRLDEREITPGSLDLLLDIQCPLALPRPQPGTVYADNHVHLGGVSSVGTALLSLATRAKPPAQQWRLPNRFHLTFAPHYNDPVRVITAAYAKLFAAIRRACLRPEAQEPRAEIWGALANDLRPLLKHGLVLDAVPLAGFGGLDSIWTPDNTDPIQPLLYLTAHRANSGDFGGAYLLFATLLCRLHRRVPAASQPLHLAILGFIHLTHILRATIIMQGVGLGDFMEHFRSSSRSEGKSRFRSIRWLTAHSDHRAEIKMGTINSTRLKQLLTESSGSDASRGTHPWQRFHFCYHFSRTTKGSTTAAGMLGRHEKQRRQVRQQAEDLRRMLHEVAFTTKPAMIGGQSVRLEISGLVRCFDVAGNENDTPIEVFAPALRWLRDQPIIQLDRRERLAGRRALSIHAGEDFSHIAGGLRHVDETIRFCNMGTGDRLGHALALGINPHTWAERQGRAVVSLESHFDNIVWLWHYATMLSGKIPEAGNILPLLERRRQFYARLLHLDTFGAEVQYRAWQLRANASGTSARWEEEPHLANTRHWAPDFARIPDLADRPEYAMHREYLHRRHIVANGRQVVVHLLDDRMPSEDRDGLGSAEIDFLEALQDHLMTEYDRRGIIIEVCPSSNIYIGRISDCREHPCLRWHPPRSSLLDRGAVFNRFGLRTGPVKVCVNTDDPGIFPTNIHTEHALLRSAAQDQFQLSTHEAELWTDRLRRQGVDVFDRAHADIPYRVE